MTDPTNADPWGPLNPAAPGPWTARDKDCQNTQPRAGILLLINVLLPRKTMG
jgi:hypothetical protein